MSTFNNAKNVAFVVSLGNEKDPKQTRLLESMECKTTPLSNRVGALGSQLASLGKYAYILHQKDVKEDGTTKTPHVHIVITSDKGASSNTWIKSISELLGLEKEAISVEPVRSLTGALRYLIHADEPTKFQYEKDAIQTNMAKAVEEALNQHDITLEGLMKCATASEYFTYVGKDNYSKYRSAWKDLLEESAERRKTKNAYTRFREEALAVVDEMGDYLNDESKFKSKETEDLLRRWQQRLLWGSVDD